jgi:hypothetical protein
MDAKNLSKISTEEFGEILLLHPGIIHSFYLNELWYDVVCKRFLEPRTVLISGSTPYSHSTIFDLPSYIPSELHEDIGIKQSNECVQEIIEGLNDFNKKGVWLIKKTDLTRLITNYEKLK